MLEHAVTKRIVRLLKSFAQSDDKTRWVATKATNTLRLIDHKAKWWRFDAQMKREHLINQAFDRRHGTDTADETSLVLTGVPEELAARGNNLYRPLWESEFHAALAALNIRFDGFTFIDVGSGKGKLMMLASNYPFARIIGVEYSPGLHAIAQANIARYHSPTQRCKKLEAVLSDALQYRLPDGPMVCLIFNALDPSTMRMVMKNIENEVSLRDAPAYVIYVNLRDVSEIDDGLDLKKLQRLKATRKIVILGNAAACRDAPAAP